MLILSIVPVLALARRHPWSRPSLAEAARQPVSSPRGGYVKTTSKDLSTAPKDRRIIFWLINEPG